MKKIILATLAAVLGSMSLHAQTTYAIGQVTCSPGGNIYCYGIPLSLAGATPASVWLDEGGNANFLKFSGGLNSLGEATINQDSTYQPTYGTVTETRNGVTKTASVVTSLSLTYYGTDASGNGYNGAMTISFDYYYVWTCSGRACGGVIGWHRRVTGGSTTFAVAGARMFSPIAPTPGCLPGDKDCPQKQKNQE
jgi:hypothetical protein